MPVPPSIGWSLDRLSGVGSLAGRSSFGLGVRPQSLHSFGLADENLFQSLSKSFYYNGRYIPRRMPLVVSPIGDAVPGAGLDVQQQLG